MTEPGFYPDPSGSSDERYWDGNEWTDHLRPKPGRGESSGPPKFASGAQSVANDPSPVTLVSDADALPRSRRPLGVAVVAAVVLSLTVAGVYWAVRSPDAEITDSDRGVATDDQSVDEGGADPLENGGSGANAEASRADASPSDGSAVATCPATYGLRFYSRQIPEPEDYIGLVETGNSIEAYDLLSGDLLWEHSANDVRIDTAVENGGLFAFSNDLGAAAVLANDGAEVVKGMDGYSDDLWPVSFGAGKCGVVASDREGTDTVLFDLDGTEQWRVQAELRYADEDAGVFVGYTPAGWLGSWDLSSGEEVWSSATISREWLDGLRAKKADGALVIHDVDGTALAVDVRNGSTYRSMVLPPGNLFFTDSPVVLFIGESGSYIAALRAKEGVVAWIRDDFEEYHDSDLENFELGGSGKLVAMVRRESEDVMVMVDLVTGREDWAISDLGENGSCDGCISDIWPTGNGLIAASGRSLLGVDIVAGRVLWTSEDSQGAKTTAYLPGYRDGDVSEYFHPRTGQKIWSGEEFEAWASPGEIVVVRAAGSWIGLDASTGEELWEVPDE